MIAINFNDIRGISLNLDTYILSKNDRVIIERIEVSGATAYEKVKYYNFNTDKITDSFSAPSLTPLLKITEL